MSRLRLLASLALLLSAFGCGGDASEGDALPDADASTTGASPAMDFSLPALDGSRFRLSDHRGEVVVLNFWATWCLPCLAEMPEFDRLQDELADQGVLFVGVSQDEGGLDTVRPFAERLDIGYPLVADAELDVSAQFGGVSILPTTFVIDREGRIHASAYGALSRDDVLGLLGDLVDAPPDDAAETDEAA